MLRNRRKLAFLVWLVFLSVTGPLNASDLNCQWTQGIVKVVSVNQSAAGNCILLSTARSQKLPMPAIQHFSGTRGESIMAADFLDTILCPGKNYFRVNTSGIRELHISQLQISPPVLRVLIVAASAEAFRSVDFRSVSGGLIIK